MSKQSKAGKKHFENTDAKRPPKTFILRLYSLWEGLLLQSKVTAKIMKTSWCALCLSEPVHLIRSSDMISLVHSPLHLSCLVCSWAFRIRLFRGILISNRWLFIFLLHACVICQWCAGGCGKIRHETTSWNYWTLRKVSVIYFLQRHSKSCWDSPKRPQTTALWDNLCHLKSLRSPSVKK